MAVIELATCIKSIRTSHPATIPDGHFILGGNCFHRPAMEPSDTPSPPCIFSIHLVKNDRLTDWNFEPFHFLNGQALKIHDDTTQ